MGRCESSAAICCDCTAISCPPVCCTKFGLLPRKQKGYDINVGDYDKRTAIHLACSEGNLKIVKVLIEELSAHHSPSGLKSAPCFLNTASVSTETGPSQSS